jgi:hypothetical protein
MALLKAALQEDVVSMLEVAMLHQDLEQLCDLGKSTFEWKLKKQHGLEE